MKTTTILLSKTEFIEKDGKLYYKELGRHTYEPHPWEARFKQLRAKGMRYAAIVDKLNGEGYTTKWGKKITIDVIRCRLHYLKQMAKPKT